MTREFGVGPISGPFPWGRCALALGLLAIVAASVVLTLALWMLPPRAADELIVGNRLDPGTRRVLLAGVLGAAALPIVVGLGLVATKGRAGADVLSRLADRCGPLAVAFMVPSLLDYRVWYNANQTVYLALLLAMVLVLERLLFRAFEAGLRLPWSWRAPAANARAEPDALPWPARLLPLAGVIAAAAGYVAYTAYFSIMAHQRLATAAFDLGIFDNLMFNALNGFPFRSTVAIPGGSYLSNHAEYAMFLFVPLYALRPGPEALLFLQSLMIGLAAIPLYFFAATQLSRAAAAVLACAYLLYAPLHGPNFYDFHWMPVSMVFLFWLFHAIAKRRLWMIVPLVVIICAIREDAALGLVALGLFLVVTEHWPGFGAVLAAVTTLWFVLVRFVIMPWAGPWWFADIYQDLAAPGERGFGSVVTTVLINPNYFLRTLATDAKLQYAGHLLAPLALVPLRRPAFWLLMLPGFFVTLMTTGYWPTLSIAFQYTTHWIPWLFGCVVIELRLRRERRGSAAMRATLVAIAIGVLCHSYVFGALLQRNTFRGGVERVSFWITPQERQRYQDLRTLAAMVPRDASVAASEPIVPHVSTRREVYTLRYHHGDADYLFLSRQMMHGRTLRVARDAVGKHRYGLVASQGEFYLLKRGHDSPGTESALSVLGLKAGSPGRDRPGAGA